MGGVKALPKAHRWAGRSDCPLKSWFCHLEVPGKVFKLLCASVPSFVKQPYSPALAWRWLPRRMLWERLHAPCQAPSASSSCSQGYASFRSPQGPCRAVSQAPGSLVSPHRSGVYGMRLDPMVSQPSQTHRLGNSDLGGPQGPPIKGTSHLRVAAPLPHSHKIAVHWEQLHSKLTLCHHGVHTVLQASQVTLHHLAEGLPG